MVSQIGEECAEHLCGACGNGKRKTGPVGHLPGSDERDGIG